MSRIKKLIKLVYEKRRIVMLFFAGVVVSMFVALAIGKFYQRLDNREDRGAIPIADGHFGEDYPLPVYLDQGWDEADSLWYYNTTQGSGLIPYDFFLELELENSQVKLRDPQIVDQYRYLPQRESRFNPDALPVGFVKEVYQGKDYVGYTCAACHTSQVNYTNADTNEKYAVRIDGGPAMADMDGFLVAMEKGMEQTLEDTKKQQRFVDAVLALDNDYDSKDEILSDLEKWTRTVQLYNLSNESDVPYGYARLDAFGRIYNRVLQHVINKDQARNLMLNTVDDTGNPFITEAQADLVLKGVNEYLIGNRDFALVWDRLMQPPPYPNLDEDQLIHFRNKLFNVPNAPVSYPFLWDIVQSDYVQWNGLANNSGVGPLGRNAGEVIGVFGILDWEVKDPGFSLSAYISGQKRKNKIIKFKSSIDLVNLERLESHLKKLMSPEWPAFFPPIVEAKKAKGELLYEKHCISCHVKIERDNWDRVVIANMSGIKVVGTDPQMAENSVNYTGKSGNLKYTYQDTDVGKTILDDEAPVAQILTAVTKGVVATPDADKGFIRRRLDWLYLLASSFFDNDIEASVKSGNYEPDTTSSPFQSLLSYKARSLNGIWATAPYLHNGSVPTLYDLLLPVKQDGDPEEGEYRPEKFYVGSREFDPVNVGFKSQGYDGFLFDTNIPGNKNTGHEYSSRERKLANGEVIPALTPEERMELLEYLKSL